MSVVLLSQWHSVDGRILQLLDRCLKIVDPELFGYLRMKNLSAEIYAFPCSFFFFACSSSGAMSMKVIFFQLSLPCAHAHLLWTKS